MTVGGSFAIGVLDEKDVVRVYLTRDLFKSLKNYRDRDRLMVPVFAVECDDEQLLLEMMSFEKLPARLPLREAKGRFGDAILDGQVQDTVFDHLSKVPLDRATRVLQRWAAA